MTETTGPDGRQHTGDELRAMLFSGAQHRGYLNLRGAVHLLAFTDVPDWRGFRPLVDIETVPAPVTTRDGKPWQATASVHAAHVRDWAGLLDATRGASLSGSGRRLLELAVGMAFGTPVDLREHLGGLGHVGKRRVVEAVAIATGADEYYRLDFTPTPALDALLDFHRSSLLPAGGHQTQTGEAGR